MAPALAPILGKYAGDERLPSIVTIMRKNFRYGTYKQRQLFILMAAEVMNLDPALFTAHYKYDMISLVADSVVNVRAVLARKLGQHF